MSAIDGLRQRRRAVLLGEDAADSAIEFEETKAKLSGRLSSAGSNEPLALTDAKIFGALVAIAALIRFFRLSYPNEVVYDEFHFGKWVNSVNKNVFLFDLFPPLAKLLIAWTAWLFGYPTGCFDFQSLGETFPDHCGRLGAAALRIVPATLGSFSPGLMYLTLRLMNISAVSSLLAGIFVVFDSLHIIMSRIAMADIILIVFCQLALVTALLAFRIPSVARRSRHRVLLLVLSGIFCGQAMGTKWTAFGTPLLILAVGLFGISPFLPDAPLPLAEVAIFLGSIMVSYYFVFLTFFWTCNNAGSGDAFMSRKFQATLIGNQFHPLGENSTADEVQLSDWAKFRELNYKMMNHNRGVRGNSTTSPSWYQWPVNWRGSLLWVNRDKNRARIFLMMNPVVAWSTVLGMGVFVALIIILVRYRMQIQEHAQDEMLPKVYTGVMFQATWLMAMLPTVVIYRAGPLYQYLPALMFAEMVSSVAVETLSVPRIRALVVLVFAVLTAGGFLFWSPWIYATEISAHSHRIRSWLPRWRV